MRARTVDDVGGDRAGRAAEADDGGMGQSGSRDGHRGPARGAAAIRGYAGDRRESDRSRKWKRAGKRDTMYRTVAGQDEAQDRAPDDDDGRDGRPDRAGTE